MQIQLNHSDSITEWSQQQCSQWIWAEAGGYWALSSWWMGSTWSVKLTLLGYLEQEVESISLVTCQNAPSLSKSKECATGYQKCILPLESLGLLHELKVVENAKKKKKNPSLYHGGPTSEVMTCPSIGQNWDKLSKLPMSTNFLNGQIKQNGRELSQIKKKKCRINYHQLTKAFIGLFTSPLTVKQKQSQASLIIFSPTL